jgi:hypothetical protein
MCKLDDSQFKDLNSLTYNEFLQLITEDKTIPDSWKEIFRGTTLNDQNITLDSLRKMLGAGEKQNAANKTAQG